jgi:hypothetical protein
VLWIGLAVMVVRPLWTFVMPSAHLSVINSRSNSPMPARTVNISLPAGHQAIAPPLAEGHEGLLPIRLRRSMLRLG